MTIANEPQQIAYRVRDVARATSLSERTIWSAVQRGDLPASKVGRAVLIRPIDVEEWLKRCSKPAAVSSGTEQ
jgi:excisionase family DNA binding protein